MFLDIFLVLEVIPQVSEKRRLSAQELQNLFYLSKLFSVSHRHEFFLGFFGIKHND